jgi:hypothetical protein
MTRDGGLLPSPHWTVYRQCVFAPTTRGVSRWVGDVLSATNAGAVWWGKGASLANHLTGILQYAGRQRHSMGLSRRPRGPRTRSRSDASIADFLALLHGSTRCHDTVPEVSGINGSRATNRWSVSCETWGSPTKPPCLCFLHVEFDQSRFTFQDHLDVRPVLVTW